MWPTLLLSFLAVLSTKNEDMITILPAHLHALLADLNYCYYKNTRHHTTTTGYQEVSVSDTKLYEVVKKHSGLSPKSYIIKRRILEAQRMLLYEQLSTAQRQNI